MKVMKSVGKPRPQCATCPWRADVDPRDIPGGHGHVVPEKLAVHTPSGVESLAHDLRVATCHEAAIGAKLPCVGWLVHQLGPGNNLAVRVAVLRGSLDANVRTIGEQRDLPQELLFRTLKTSKGRSSS